MSRPLEEAFKTIEFNIRVSTAAANKVVNRETFIGKPGDNNSPFATVRSNGVAKRSALNNRGSLGLEIKVIHNSKILLYI